MRVPPVIGGTTITSTGQDAFSRNGIVSLELPDTITSIGQGLLFNNSGLTHLKLPNNPALTFLPAYMAQSSGLLMVDVPDSVTSMADTTFHVNTKIRATPGSYVHKWCQTYGRTFVSNGQTPLRPETMWTAENDLFSANHLHPFYAWLTNSGTFPIASGDADHPGVSVCYSHATNLNSGATLTLDSASCIQLAGGEEIVVCFQFWTLNADVKYRIGFSDQRAVGTPTDAVILTGTGTTAYLEAWAGGVMSQSVSIITLEQGVWYRMTLRIADAATSASCTIKKISTGVEQTATVSGLPTGSQKTTATFGSYKTTAGAVGMLALDYVRVSCSRYLNR